MIHSYILIFVFCFAFILTKNTFLSHLLWHNKNPCFFGFPTHQGGAVNRSPTRTWSLQWKLATTIGCSSLQRGRTLPTEMTHFHHRRPWFSRPGKKRKKSPETTRVGWKRVGTCGCLKFFFWGGELFFVKHRLRIVYWDKWYWVFLLSHTGYVYHVCTTSTKRKINMLEHCRFFPPIKPFEKTNKKRWKTQATNVSMCPLYVVCWSHFGQVHTDSFPTPEEIRVQTIGTVRSPYKERVFRAGMGEGWMYCCCFFPELMGSL